MTIVTTSLCSICTTCKCKGMICLDNSFSIGLETKCHGCGASKTHSTNWQVTYNIVTTVSMYVFLDIYIYIQTYIYTYKHIYIQTRIYILNVTPCKHVNDFFVQVQANLTSWMWAIGAIYRWEWFQLLSVNTWPNMLQGLPYYRDCLPVSRFIFKAHDILLHKGWSPNLARASISLNMFWNQMPF